MVIIPDWSACVNGHHCKSAFHVKILLLVSYEARIRYDTDTQIRDFPKSRIRHKTTQKLVGLGVGYSVCNQNDKNCYYHPTIWIEGVQPVYKRKGQRVYI